MPAGVDPAVVKREKDILADKSRQQGKPENMIEKIVEFGSQDFLQGADTCSSSRSSSTTRRSVGQALKEAEGKVGGPIKIAGFVRYALGEGIEKAANNGFAAEADRGAAPQSAASLFCGPNGHCTRVSAAPGAETPMIRA